MGLYKGKIITLDDVLKVREKLNDLYDKYTFMERDDEDEIYGIPYNEYEKLEGMSFRISSADEYSFTLYESIFIFHKVFIKDIKDDIVNLDNNLFEME